MENKDILIYGMVIFIVFTASMIMLLGYGGYIEELNRWKFVIFTGGIAFAFFYMWSSRKAYDPEELGEPAGYLHDPERGLLTMAFPIDWLVDGKKMFWLSIIVALIIGVAMINISPKDAEGKPTGAFFVAIPELSATGEIPVGLEEPDEFVQIAFAAEPAALGENSIFFACLFAALFGFSALFFNRFMDPKLALIFAALFAIIACSMIFMVYHTMRYGAEDTVMLSVLLFGVSQALLILLTGSIIPGAVFHSVSNAMQQALEFTSVEYLSAVCIVIIIFMILLGVFLTRKYSE